MPEPQRRNYVLALAVAALVTAAVSAGVTALLINIFERKQEAQDPFYRVVDIDDNTVDPAVWGRNFPLHYDDYTKTTEQVNTLYGGSDAIPNEPTADDPRTQVAQSKLEWDPRLKRMWAGYAFAIDFREERGHAYMLEDQMFTGRHAVPQPGTCLHCHSSIYNAYKDAGDGDIIAGFEKLNPLPYEEAVKFVEHPISCIDCHEPETMDLRVTRPAFIEGMRTLKAREGVENYDVNRDATRQEMRTFVCAQCHDEYYFKGEGKRLVYPWHKGQRADEILAYYDEIGFKDWTHAETGAPMLKAQHPEFEMWSQGIHARSGVTCADCHMPYKRVGAMKISDHHVRSPLLNVNNACQTCHKVPEQELLERVERIQTNTMEMRHHAMDALVDLIDGMVQAQEAGLSEDQLDAARNYQRKATFLLDFVEAENSAGFHASQEAARILFLSMDHLRQGQKALAPSVEPAPPGERSRSARRGLDQTP